jgi:hypothetical protein
MDAAAAKALILSVATATGHPSYIHRLQCLTHTVGSHGRAFEASLTFRYLDRPTHIAFNRS